jgi:intracellular multiplication protein IcmC
LHQKFPSRDYSLPALFLASAAIWLGTATGASAQVASFGDMLCEAFENAAPFGEMFQWVAYIAGVSAALRGLYHFKAHADNPGQNKLAVPLMYMFGGMGLLALPGFIGMIQESLFENGGGGNVECAAVAVTGAGSTTTTLNTMMVGFMDNIGQPLITIASVVAFLAGLVMVITGLMKASKAGKDPQAHNPKVVLANIGFGSILMVIGENLRVFLESLFGTRDVTAPSELAWTLPEDVSEQFADAISAALYFVQVIGAIAFVRGFLILKKVVEGTTNDPLAKALTHIIGGAIAVNIAAFLRIMDNTFGTALVN